jgi:hypothetical protein
VVVVGVVVVGVVLVRVLLVPGVLIGVARVDMVVARWIAQAVIGPGLPGDVGSTRIW